MSIKSGQIVWNGKGFVIDRVQTGGATNLNIPQERVYEDGNPLSVGIVRDIPDLTFELESFDVSTDLEALITGQVPSSISTGVPIDFLNSIPLDVISPFKTSLTNTAVIRGLALPYLTLETALYRFGVRQSATETFTLRGDSIFYIPGSPYYQEFNAAGAGPYTLNHTAIPYDEEGDLMHVLGVCWVNSDGSYKRLFHGTDYTDTTTNFTLTAAAAAALPGGAKLKVVYGSTVAADVPQSDHTSSIIKPAAVRAKDIDVYISDGAATPTLIRWDGVQSFEVTRRVTLQNDEEFGNKKYVSQDYDTAEVSGTIGVKAVDAANLWAKIAQVANVSLSEVVGVYSSNPMPLELHVNHPDTGARLKTLYVPDARFTPPPVQARVNQKLEVTFPFQSETGQLQTYKGAR